MAESEEELKSLLMKVQVESEKVGLKLNIQKMKIMTSSPITSWQIDGETVETVSDFIFLGSKITADGDCSHEIKRCVLLGRKVMTNLDSIFKGRDITLPTKIRLVKAMVFPVVMYACESWTVKKAAFELWCWRRLLRVPWTARRSNQSILKEISPGISLERMMLKLKLQYFGHLMRRVDSLEKTNAGMDGGQEEKGMTEDEMAGWHHQLNGHEFEWTPGVGDGQWGLVCCSSWGCKESDMTERLNWTEWMNIDILNKVQILFIFLFVCFSIFFLFHVSFRIPHMFGHNVFLGSSCLWQFLRFQWLLTIFNDLILKCAGQIFVKCPLVAKSLQSCPTLCDPIDSSPPGSPVPEILQARTLEWVAISFSSAWKWKVNIFLMISLGYVFWGIRAQK